MDGFTMFVFLVPIVIIGITISKIDDRLKEITPLLLSIRAILETEREKE